MIFRTLLVVLSIFLCPFFAYANDNVEAATENEECTTEWSPVQFSIWNPTQLIGEDKGIYGLMLSLIYGKNAHVRAQNISDLLEKARKLQMLPAVAAAVLSQERII